MTAIELLRRRLLDNPQAVVARELGVSKTSVSQLTAGKYKASTVRMEERIMTLYGGNDGVFLCPHKDERITPLECATTWERAVAAGTKAPGNPVTIRQFHACRNCLIRK
jgi:hypothetical protein